jgi:hypothetical protein
MKSKCKILTSYEDPSNTNGVRMDKVPRNGATRAIHGFIFGVSAVHARHYDDQVLLDQEQDHQRWLHKAYRPIRRFVFHAIH